MAALWRRGADDLGLKHALSDRLLPLLTAAMVFLAALAGAGSIVAAGLVAHWRPGAGASVTIQVPQPEDPIAGVARATAAAAVLGPAARRLPRAEVAGLLRPWLGEDVSRLSLALPAIFVQLGALPPGTEARLAQAAPGTMVARDDVWAGRLAALAASLQACAALVLAVVAGMAGAMMAVATRAGLADRRNAMEIVHGLGATDRMIAGRFAARITLLAAAGAVPGLLLAIPVLLGLARLAAPFQPDMSAALPDVAQHGVLAGLPPMLWALLASLPPLAAGIGWTTAQLTVRHWLMRLP